MRRLARICFRSLDAKPTAARPPRLRYAPIGVPEPDGMQAGPPVPWLSARLRTPGHGEWPRQVARGALAAILVLCAACATVPYTNRSQVLLISEAEEAKLGVQAYAQELSRAKVDKEPKVNEVVTRVGNRIAAAADKPDYAWQFTVIDAPDVANAFALPGGKVAVYTGIFPIAQDEAGLAAVMGHEVAHALARHSGERLSQGVLLQVGMAGAAAALGSGTGADPATQRMVMQALGLGAQVGVVLPFSRSHESEADRIGLILMAKAGYDPEAALHLWERMEAQGGPGPAEFLSTHPGSDTRQTQIREWLPEAMQYYRAASPATNQPLPGIRVSSKSGGGAGK